MLESSWKQALDYMFVVRCHLEPSQQWFHAGDCALRGQLLCSKCSDDQVMASLNATFDSLFSAYAKFGDCRSDGKAITLSCSDKWFRESGLIVASLPVSRPSSAAPSSGCSDIKFTSTETGIEFKKIAKTAKAIDRKHYDDFIDALVRRKVPEEEKVADARAKVREAMMKASPRQGPSAAVSVTSSSSSSSSPGEPLPAVIARLTDHKRYTGSHKLRFDQETGKGRGKEGRV